MTTRSNDKDGLMTPLFTSSGRAPRRRSARARAWLIGAGAAVGVLAAGVAAAALVRADLGLRSAGQRCDGKGTYGYTATWRGGPDASFQVNSGNQCTAGGHVCGVSNPGCIVQCSVKGECRAELRHCVIGKGMPWGRVTATDRSVYAQITAAPPGKCQ